MGHAGAAGQDLREFTVLRTGFLAEEDGLDARPAPGTVSFARGRLECIPRVSMPTPVGGPGGAAGGSLERTSVLKEGNDTAVMGAGTLPRATHGERFLGPRIRLGVVYQHNTVSGAKTNGYK